MPDLKVLTPTNAQGQVQGDFIDYGEQRTGLRRLQNVSRDLGTGSREWSADGQDYSWKDGQLVAGTRASDVDAERYRAMGAKTRAAVQLDPGQANQSRGLQLNALQHMRAQADGSAPSAAAIMSQRANQTAAQTMGGAAAGAKTTGSGLAALRRSTGAASPTMLAANAQNAGQRLGEISQGQERYAAGTLAAEGQDVGTATTNAQLVAQQRELEQQRQQFYEGLGFDTQNTQMVAARQDVDTRAKQQQVEFDAERARKQGKVTAFKAGLSLSMSDPRAKQAVRSLDMGSLGSLSRGRH
jgi:hypothetical protein